MEVLFGSVSIGSDRLFHIDVMAIPDALVSVGTVLPNLAQQEWSLT